MTLIASQPSKRIIWLLATRPKTLIASISPVLIGSSMAMKMVFQPGFFATTRRSASNCESR
jgi:1,4-dihydroxy-2-naphthoate octaprenyltransferase